MDIISIEKFLNLFLQIENHSLSKLSHSDVKELMPLLRRCSFEYVEEHPEEVRRGEILLVTDSKNRVVPYINPQLGKCIEGVETSKVTIQEIPKKEPEHKPVEEMTNYELKLLLNSSKHGYSISNKARKELKKRGIEKEHKHVKVLKRVRNEEEY